MLQYGKLMIRYDDYVIVATEFMYESSCLWIYEFLFHCWLIKALNMSMNVGESDEWIVFQIAMIHDWYLHYNMFDCNNVLMYYSIGVMG